MMASIYTPDGCVKAKLLADDNSRIMLIVRSSWDSAAVCLTSDEALDFAEQLETIAMWWAEHRPRSRWMRVKLAARRFFSWVRGS